MVNAGSLGFLAVAGVVAFYLFSKRNSMNTEIRVEGVPDTAGAPCLSCAQ